MFYRFENNACKEITLDEVNSGSITAGYIPLPDFEACYAHFGFARSTLLQCKEEKRYFKNSIEVYDDYSFFSLKITDEKDIDGEHDCIACYIKKNLFLIVDISDSDGSTRQKFADSLKRFSPEAITLEKLIFAFLDSLISDDNNVLEDTDFEINHLEESVITGQAMSDFYQQVLHRKRQMLVLRNYYEQLTGIGDELTGNENKLFENDDLRYFKIFKNKSERLKETVNLLRDSLIHLSEAYRSMLDLKLNQIMKVFTVITAIFLPLTLIVGWYGMNFKNMPELSWQYGYPTVIVLSVVVVVVCVIVFRKKKFM